MPSVYVETKEPLIHVQRRLDCWLTSSTLQEVVQYVDIITAIRTFGHHDEY